MTVHLVHSPFVVPVSDSKPEFGTLSVVEFACPGRYGHFLDPQGEDRLLPLLGKCHAPDPKRPVQSAYADGTHARLQGELERKGWRLLVVTR